MDVPVGLPTDEEYAFMAGISVAELAEIRDATPIIRYTDAQAGLHDSLTGLPVVNLLGTEYIGVVEGVYERASGFEEVWIPPELDNLVEIPGDYPPWVAVGAAAMTVGTLGVASLVTAGVEYLAGSILDKVVVSGAGYMIGKMKGVERMGQSEVPIFREGKAQAEDARDVLVGRFIAHAVSSAQQYGFEVESSYADQIAEDYNVEDNGMVYMVEKLLEFMRNGVNTKSLSYNVRNGYHPNVFVIDLKAKTCYFKHMFTGQRTKGKKK